MFLTRAAGAVAAHLVTGAPLAIFLQVDQAYDDFLALCEVNKRAVRPLEDSEMLIGASEYSGETPPAGMQHAVFLGEEDLGIVKDRFSPEGKLKVQFKFQLGARDTTGRRFNVVRTYNATWGSSKKPSSLREDIQNGRGIVITDEDVRRKIETSTVFPPGTNVILFMVHKPGENGRVFANIKGVMPYPGSDILSPEGDSTGATRVERQQADATEGLRAAARASEAIDPAEAAL